MTRKTVHMLVAVIAGLVLLLFVLQGNERDDLVTLQRPLLPDFQSVANDVTEIRIVRSDDTVTIRRSDNDWLVEDRDDYPADIGKVGNLVAALAYATILEEKTSLPEQYDRLGVTEPEEGGSGTKVVMSGPGSSYAVILGESTRERRYARVAGDATSYLVDRDPEVPESAGDWLLPRIADVPSMRVRRVVITHADGDRITIEKSDQEQTDFDVIGIPEGRELSYATVGNSIAGALGMLELDDVRTAVEFTPATTTVFETWDGLRVTAEAVTEDDATWIAFSAETIGDDSAAGPQAADINERVSGWQYRVPEYKANQLVRRWDDILKAESQDE